MASLLFLGSFVGYAPISDSPPQKVPKIQVFFSPHGGYEKDAPACVDVICDLIKNEKTSIHVRAYSFTSKRIGEALCEAAKRGVNVSIIADRSNRTDKNSICPICRDAGCDVVFDDNHPISHGKIMVFDRKISVVGSYNFSANAERNAETIVVLNDKSVAEKLIADFDHHYAHSEK